MKLHQNSFINYMNKHNTLFRISNIRNYRLMCKILNLKSNLALLDFGHYTDFKITFTELQKYFYYNRLLPILKNKNAFVNNKLNCKFTEISPQGNPIFKNSILNVEIKDLYSKFKSLVILKKALVRKKVVIGRIVRQVKYGFLVTVLGFFAFLPNRHNGHNGLKSEIFCYHAIPLRVIEMKLGKVSKGGRNYVNIVVSFTKAKKKLLKRRRKSLINKLKESSLMSNKINILKNLKKPNKNKLKKILAFMKIDTNF